MSFDLDLATRRALVTGGTKGVGVVEGDYEGGKQIISITSTEYVIDGGTVPTV